LKPASAIRSRHPARPLYNAPDFPLVLPQARTKNGVGQSTKDLTEHPWAGTDVAMILTARDEAGNEGQSTALEFRLPERPFSKPMARALVEQRRILALDGDAQAKAITALHAVPAQRFQTRCWRRRVWVGRPARCPPASSILAQGDLTAWLRRQADANRSAGPILW